MKSISAVGTVISSPTTVARPHLENIAHVRDLHATMLHLLGINHTRFNVPFQEHDLGLTGVLPCRVIDEILV